MHVDDRRGAILESWIGPPGGVADGARLRGRVRPQAERAVGSGSRSCLLFLLPFVDLRRPFRMLHLDLLVLLGFGVSHVFFNRGEICDVGAARLSRCCSTCSCECCGMGWRRARARGRARAARADRVARARRWSSCVGFRIGAERDRLERDRRRLLGRDRRGPDRGRRRALRRRVRPGQRAAATRYGPGQLPRLRAVGAAVPWSGTLGRPARRARAPRSRSTC